MIQAANIKNVEPKASPKANGKNSSAADFDSKLEGEDFANELESSLAAEEETNPKVKPVQVSADQVMEFPSKLIKLPDSGPDAVNPKVFDPAMTLGVDSIVGPKTTEVPVELSNEQILKLAQGEGNAAINAEVEAELTQAMLKTSQVQGSPKINAEVEAELTQAMLKTPQVHGNSKINAEVELELTQAMLKTPQVQTGRTPAIDLAKGEVDPQLMNMEDFVAQKNLAVKKSLNNTSAYGIQNKAKTINAGSDTGLTSTQTISELGAETDKGSSMNSQQFILNAQADMGTNAKVNEAQAAVKTFNMSNIKSEDSNQIMNQITNYISQAKAAKEPTVNMRVNHEELGMIDITVNKSAGNDAIAINIATHSTDGKNFFQTNSKELLSHLSTSGLNVSDMKVETPSQTAKNDFDFGSQSGRGGSGQEKQFGSEQNQKRHDSDRRQSLWDILQDKEAA